MGLSPTSARLKMFVDDSFQSINESGVAHQNARTGEEKTLPKAANQSNQGFERLLSGHFLSSCGFGQDTFFFVVALYFLQFFGVYGLLLKEIGITGSPNANCIF